MAPDSTTPVDEHPGETPPEEIEDAALSPEQEAKLTDRVIASVKGVIEEVVETVVGKKEPASGGETATKEPSTTREIEKHVEEQVKAAVKKIQAESQEKEEVKTPTKEPEKPPVTLSRMTKFLWGGQDD